MYLAKDPKVKQSLLDEIDKVFAALDASKNYDDYDIETSENFEYLRYCFYESMRLEPPVPMSSSNMFSRDVNIGGINIKAGTRFHVNITQLHHDP